MADYLLRAPDEDMARWKNDAEIRRVSFAEYLRALLEANHRPVEPARVAATADAVYTGRQARPDPK